MSIEIVLVPLAMAAFAAWKARSIEEGNACMVETRLKDPVLLAEALTATGAIDVSASAGKVKADWGDLTASFSRGEDGVLTAHFDTEDSDRALLLISDVDKAYGLAVQRIVLERVQQRAEAMGMGVASEVASPDGAVTIVLEEVHA